MASYVISYDRQDDDFVRELVSIMKRDNLDVWYDRDIDYGEPFSRVIKREIDTRDEVIVLWSPASVDSHWVENEAAYALNQRKLRPACINGLEVTDVPLGFYALNTFTFEDNKPEYLRRAVRQFLHKRELGTSRTSVKARETGRPTSDARDGAKPWPIWVTAPLLLGALGLSGYAGDQFGFTSQKLQVADARYAAAQQAFQDQYDAIRMRPEISLSGKQLLDWAEHVYAQVFPGSDHLSQKKTRLERGMNDLTNILDSKSQSVLPSDQEGSQ